jgi:hypothetical protein
MKTLAALAALALVTTPAAALAQATSTLTASAPVANPPPQTTPSTTANADTGYAGDAHGAAFRDIDQRIGALEGKVGKNRKAAAALSKIKGEAKYRRARHGGELRDWDRELLNKQLDQLEASLGA